MSLYNLSNRIPKASFTSNRSNSLQRKCTCGQHTVAGGECAECRRKKLQRQASNYAKPETVSPIVEQVLRSSGQPLDAETRAFMEPRFGHDFSQVRVHTNAQAAQSARMTQALSYTMGRNIVFASGHYQPRTYAGKQLLAHELTHVVQQQNSSPSLGPSDQMQVSTPQEPMELEANRLSTHVVAGGNAQVQHRVRVGHYVARQRDAGVPLPGGVPEPTERPDASTTPADVEPAPRPRDAGPAPRSSTRTTRSARSIATDHARCLDQADQWQFECQERGALLCTILGARFGGNRGVGAGAACVTIYNRVCRNTKRIDDAFCNSKRDCLLAGASTRKKPSECGTWWDNWSSGGSGDPWPDFDESRDRYVEWPSA